MEILIIGGFLGSGKTTVIGKLLRGMVAEGETVALIENEIGEVGIDDVFFEGAGLSVTPLFGGCVCCQISGSLLEATTNIQDTISPDWLVIEMTGLAYMSDMRDLFKRYGRTGITVHTVSVLDSSRWPVLKLAMAHLVESQLEDADVVLINKTDVTPVTEALTAEVTQLSGVAAILPISATQENADLWRRLKDSRKTTGGQ